MIQIKRFINELMTSNCYIVWDDVTMGAIVIDPASEHSLNEIEFLTRKGLNLDYIILTHEHTDHTWGVNALLDKYDVKVICSDNCKANLPEAGNTYFRLYYEWEDYTYSVRKVDYTTESLNNRLDWYNHVIKFIPTPGHSMGSICIDIEGNLFTGDTIMQYKAYVNKRNGNFELYKQSIQTIVDLFFEDSIIYPGHGVKFLLKDKENIVNHSNLKFHDMVKLLDLQAITMQHGDEYKAAVNRVIESGWFLQGNENKQFEADYAKYIGSKECIAVANGLDALYLIMRAYKEMGIIQDGDEIIVPANTYIATIIGITRNNLVPVLVEPSFENLEIDIDKIEAAITPKTKGIMIVHLYGRVAYNDKLGEICKKHNLKLMEDCAQSQGCAWKGVKTGSLGDAAAHSFYPGKNLGAFGDAGAVTTSDHELASVIRAVANYGSQKKYVFKYVGMNSRMSEPDAAVLNVKLKYLDEDNAQRQKLAAYYYENIKNPLITLPTRIVDENNVYHQFPIFCERRDELQEFLKKNGVQTLIHYPIPPHKQECYKSWNDREYPITEKIHNQELSIPMSQLVKKEEFKIVVDLLNQFK